VKTPIGARGECRIEVEGEGERVILFTNAALMTAEKELGQSITRIIQKYERGDVSISDYAVLTRLGLETARREYKEARASYTLVDAVHIMDAVGFVNVASMVYGALAAVFGYGVKTPGGKAEESPPAI
jgi:hypothetical protein